MQRPEPGPANEYLTDAAALILRSYEHWIGRALVDPSAPPVERARRLFEAPFVVLAHQGSEEPVFFYGNRAAQHLFELTWEELTRLPSRRSAEPMHRAERERFLARVAEQGYVDDYSGIRISKSGQRFRIEDAVVWNLVTPNGTPCGQAATFDRWTYVD